jgi:DNA-binding MarR family transcriptional regulator
MAGAWRRVFYLICAYWQIFSSSGLFAGLLAPRTCPAYDRHMLSRNLTRSFDCLSAMRALGEPTRLSLVRQLIGGPKPVTELCDTLHVTPYNVSKHLRVLKEAGLLEVEKQGQQRIYALATAFREKLSNNSNTLDLGCCQFHFDKLPE